MLPPIKLCHVTSFSSKVPLKNGKYTLSGLGVNSMFPWLDFSLDFTNITQIVTAESIERFVKNQSDLGIGYFNFYDQNENYSLPVPSYSLSLGFFSGYNVHKFEEELKHSTEDGYGVIDNFKAFTSEAYLLIFTWFLTLLSIIILRTIVIQRRVDLTHTLKKVVKYTNLVMAGRDKRWRHLSVLMHFGLFLLLTPFCILFKTNQVLIKEPSVINSYEAIMMHKAEMVFSMSYGYEMDYLRQEGDLGTGNTMDRIWKYFKAHSRQEVLDRSPESLQKLEKLAKEVVAKKIVFIASDAVAEGIRQAACSWSIHPNLYQMLLFHDVHQKEHLAGFAFASSKPPKVLIKRLRNAFEFYLLNYLKGTADNYEGITFLVNPAHHRQRQLVLCETRGTVEQFQKEGADMKPSDFTSYTKFLKILLIFISIAVFILLLESCSSNWHQK